MMWKPHSVESILESDAGADAERGWVGLGEGVWALMVLVRMGKTHSTGSHV